MDEPKFLKLNEVLYLHDESLRLHGGSSGIGDLGMVESALGAARNTFWYGGDGIAESQAFVDANKRTGAAAALVFLACNGVRFPKDDGSVYNALIDIANKLLDKPGLAALLRQMAARHN